jgi:peptide/nickel transport system substrate-binding protein
MGRLVQVAGGALIVALLLFSVSSVAAVTSALVIGHSVKLAPINPLTNTATLSANISALIFDSLVELDESGNMRPALAREWKMAPDGTAWTFYLRQGVFFHDGTSLTAGDVVATYAALKTSGAGFIHFGLANIDSVEAVNSREVRFNLKRFDSFLPFYFYLIKIVPAKDITEGVGGTKTNGTGPFRLKSFSEDAIELEAFKKHFRGKPQLPGITVIILPSQRACLSHLVAGDLDMVFIEDSADITSLLGVPGIKLIDTGMRSIYMIILNQQSAHLRDARLRRALNLGLDHAYLKDHIKQMEGDIADSAPFITWYGEKSVVPFNYRPQDAKKLFQGVGYGDADADHILDKNGEALSFEIALAKGSALASRILNVVKSAFENLGVTVTIREYEPQELFAKFHRKDGYEAILIPIAVQGADSLQYLLWHSKQKTTNVASYSNTEVDRLLDEMRYSQDEEARREAQRKLANAMMEDPPGIPLFIRQTKALVNDDFKGFTKDAFVFFQRLRDVYFDGASDKR